MVRHEIDPSRKTHTRSKTRNTGKRSFSAFFIYSNKRFLNYVRDINNFTHTRVRHFTRTRVHNFCQSKIERGIQSHGNKRITSIELIRNVESWQSEVTHFHFFMRKIAFQEGFRCQLLNQIPQPIFSIWKKNVERKFTYVIASLIGKAKYVEAIAYFNKVLLLARHEGNLY